MKIARSWRMVAAAMLGAVAFGWQARGDDSPVLVGEVNVEIAGVLNRPVQIIQMPGIRLPDLNVTNGSYSRPRFQDFILEHRLSSSVAPGQEPVPTTSALLSWFIRARNLQAAAVEVTITITAQIGIGGRVRLLRCYPTRYDIIQTSGNKVERVSIAFEEMEYQGP